MQLITLSGNIGRDPDLRTTQGGDDVCSFSVGVAQGFSRDAKTEWFRCSVWGKRAETVNRYLRKGMKVFVHGQLTIGEYQGKPQYDVRVNEVDWQPVKDAGQSDQRQTGGGGTGFGGGVPDDLEDDVPFASIDVNPDRRRV